MNLSLERQRVARSLNRLESAIERLVEALAHSDVTVQIERPDDTVTPVRQVCAAYAAINYGMEDEVNSSAVCLAVLGVSAEMLRRAAVVNAAKTEFKAICTSLARIRTRIAVKGEEHTKAIPVLRVILRNIQRSDLNVLAAYRKIPVLDAPPASITYTRANTRAVYRKAVDDIGELLSKSESPQAAVDRARLAGLNRRETHLALVKERYQNIRANILYEHLDKRGRGRVQKAAELPLIYAKGRSATQPIVTFPPLAVIGEVRAREPKLAPEPFLQSIPVYRYANW